MQDVIFNGAVGRIEGKYHQAEQKGAPIALLLHPHPLHGGTMNNKVVYNMFHTFVKNGFSVLRFNFRGVGKSSGVFDHGNGELLDAAIALDWIQAQNPETSCCWIGGFSFGSWIALQLLMRRPEIKGFVVASPPAASYDFTFLSPCPAPGLIIQGTNDEISLEENVFALYQKLEKQRNVEIEYYPIKNADHFFTNKLEDFNEIISKYLNSQTPRDNTPTRKVRRDRKRKQQLSE